MFGFPNSTRMVMCMEIRHFYRIGLAISVSVLPISDAVHCNRSCSALHPSSQCTASVLAVHCILHANICNLSRKRLQPPLQTFASGNLSWVCPYGILRSQRMGDAGVQGMGVP